MPNNYDAFITKHPEICDELIRQHGDLQWLKKYTDEKNGRIKEYWELKNGVFTDMSAIAIARQELEDAQEIMAKIGVSI